MQINIIAPIYNEAGNITRLHNELDKLCAKYTDIDFKFVLVNDGSKDSSHQEILELDDSRIRYVKFSRNFGKEAALIAGLEHSLEADGCAIVDSDLEMPLHHIDEMIAKWKNGCKLIICRRSNRNITRVKGKLASKFYDVYNKATGYDIVPDALDYTFLDKQVVREVIKHQEANRFFKGIIASVGFDYEVIEIEMTVRENGESSFGSFSQLFKYAIVSIAIDTKLPLYFSLYLGLASTVISILMTFKVAYDYFAHGITVEGYYSLMSVILFFFGILFIIQGVKGFYIGLIFDETKKSSLYIVDEVYEQEDK